MVLPEITAIVAHNIWVFTIREYCYLLLDNIEIFSWCVLRGVKGVGERGDSVEEGRERGRKGEGKGEARSWGMKKGGGREKERYRV